MGVTPAQTSTRSAHWVSIEEWLTRRSDDLSTPDRSIEVTTAASPAEILRERRKKSGPGVSHHTNTIPRHRYSA